jgi:hypothetical protein
MLGTLLVRGSQNVVSLVNRNQALEEIRFIVSSQIAPFEKVSGSNGASRAARLAGAGCAARRIAAVYGRVDRREGADANGDISPASMVANHAIALLTVLSGVPERHDPD